MSYKNTTSSRASNRWLLYQLAGRTLTDGPAAAAVETAKDARNRIGRVDTGPGFDAWAGSAPRSDKGLRSYWLLRLIE
jgi:hypothetical protein